MNVRVFAALSTALVTSALATSALAADAAPAEPAAPAPAAAAASTSGAGITLALRLGYAVAMGDAAKDSKMSDQVKGAIPFTLDALYNFSPSLGAGVYASYGIVSVDKDKTGADSASWLKYGAQLRYTIGDAFLGYGIGMEEVTLKYTGGEASYSGLEFAHLLAGYNFYKADKLKVGAFGDFAYGQYSTFETPAGSGDITDKAAHQWLYFGINGQYDL